MTLHIPFNVLELNYDEATTGVEFHPILSRVERCVNQIPADADDRGT